MGLPAAGDSRVVVILNRRAQTAARQDDAEKRIRDRFASRGVAIDMVFADGGAIDAAAAPLSKARTVVVAGGDGTVSLVASKAAGTGARLGILPLGTLNHFARDLKIPFDLDRAIDTAVDGRAATIDVGDVNGRVFVNNCSLGIYPHVVRARDELRAQGLRKWPAFVLASIRTLRRHPRFVVRLEIDGRPSAARTVFVLVANNEYKLSGLDFTSRPSLSSGKLFAYLAPYLRSRELPLMALRELVGRTVRGAPATGAFKTVSGQELWIESGRRRTMPVGIDGEVVEMTMPLHVRVNPGALSVMVPRD